MAAASQLLCHSPLEGSSVTLLYDDVTLLATGLRFTCGAQASHPLTWKCTIGGITHTNTVSIGTAISTFTFPVAVLGVAGMDQHGESIITWDIAPYGIGHAPTVSI